jgi:glycosyltransferase involved in cell wall biosynthesis
MFKCTVAIPIYNRIDMIDSTLKSVIEQDYPDLEILLIDDCSEDGVWEKLHSYNEPRIRLVRNETNVGLFANFNRCLNLSRGQYIRILCNDDRLQPGCIRRECDFMDANPNVALLNSAAKIVNSNDEWLGYTGRDLPESIYKGLEALRIPLQFHAHYRNPLSCPSGVMIRAGLIRKFDLKFDVNMEMAGDYSLFYNILEHGDLAVLHSEGAIVKVHPGSVGFRQKLSSTPMKELVTVITRYLHDLFNESERQVILGKLSGRIYAYATIWYLRGYRTEAIRMFRTIEDLGVSRHVRTSRALEHLVWQIYTRFKKSLR